MVNWILFLVFNVIGVCRDMIWLKVGSSNCRNFVIIIIHVKGLVNNNWLVHYIENNVLYHVWELIYFNALWYIILVSVL